MIEISTTLAVAAAEAFAIVLFTALILGYRLVRRKRIDRKAALAVAHRIKEETPARLEALRRILGEALGYTGDPLEEAVQRLSRKERLLYQRILNLYVKRDAAALGQVTIDVENHTAGCLALAPRGEAVQGDAPEPAEGGAESDSEVAGLREENERLEQELRITMETMTRMLDEYSTMFGGDAGGMGMAGMGEEGFDELAEPGTSPDPEVEIPIAAEAGEDMPTETEAEVAVEAGTAEVSAAGGAMETGAEPVQEAAVGEPAPETEAQQEDLDDIWAEALAEQQEKEAGAQK